MLYEPRTLTQVSFLASSAIELFRLSTCDFIWVWACTSELHPTRPTRAERTELENFLPIDFQNAFLDMRRINGTSDSSSAPSNAAAELAAGYASGFGWERVEVRRLYGQNDESKVG